MNTIISSHKNASYTVISSLILILAAVSSQLAHAQGGNFVKLTEAQAGKYALEKTHAYVALSYAHQGYSRPIILFRGMDASIDLDPKKIANSKITVSIDPNSIDSGVDEFDKILVGTDYFNTPKFPDISFTSTEISPLENGQYAVTGTLTMKGISKPLTLTSTFNKGGIHFKEKVPQLGFSATAKLSRSNWDLGKYAPFVGDEVTLTIEVEFLKEA